MALDQSIVKQRLEQKAQRGTGGQTFEKTDFTKIFFKPQVGEQMIRIVPAKWNKDFPIKSVWFHDNDTFKRTVYMLKNWGEKDPVEEFRKGLYADSRTSSESAKDSFDLASQIKFKEKFFIPVIVRGQEDKGVLLWEFSSQTETKILSILGKTKLGDVTDVMEGRDIEVTGTAASLMRGKKPINYVTVEVMPDMVTSPLSTNPALVQKWLTEQKDPLEVHKRYSFTEIKTMFNKWLDPEAAEEEQEAPAPQKAPLPKAPVKAPIPPPQAELDEQEEQEEAPPFVEEDDDIPPPPPPVVKRTTKAATVVAKAPEAEKTTGVVKGTGKAISAAAKFNKVFEED